MWAEPSAIETGVQWGAVALYVAATIGNCVGVIFRKPAAEKLGYRLAAAGLVVHGAALLFRWVGTGHGPYIVRYEILSSHAWLTLLLFLVFKARYPRIRPASLVVFPAVFLLIACGLFLDPTSQQLPPSLRSIWLIFHVMFYKIALSTLIIALAFAVFYLLKQGAAPGRYAMLPPLEEIDTYAYRFTGFGFIFWAIAMLAGSIWAYQSWGRFWGWDAIETWSLITWLLFGLYLHLRRFFGWQGARAAWLFLCCFAVSILTLFFTPDLATSIHAEYFR
jgi:cytochrome c-type biogenesis protein CcsB